MGCIKSRCAPCMESPVAFELGDRDEYYDRLLATLDIDFASGADLERAEVTFHVANISAFQIEVGLSEPLLEVRGGSVGRVGRAHDLIFYRHCTSRFCQKNREVSGRIKTTNDDTDIV